MIPERATGLVLRTHPLTETSLIVHWITAEAGRFATVARGARRLRSPFRGKLDLFFLADFSYRRRSRSDLHDLREVVVRDSHPQLRTDYGRLQMASYAALLVLAGTEVETPVPEFFALLEDWLERIAVMPATRELALAFEVAWLGVSGLEPEGEPARLGEEARTWLRKQRGGQAAAPVASAAVSASAFTELAAFLEVRLQDQLGRVPALRAEVLGVRATGGPAVGCQGKGQP